MNRHHKSQLIQVLAWFTAEVLLNFVGLDNLADYSEFVFNHDFNLDSRTPGVALLIASDTFAGVAIAG